MKLASSIAGSMVVTVLPPGAAVPPSASARDVVLAGVEPLDMGVGMDMDMDMDAVPVLRPAAPDPCELCPVLPEETTLPDLPALANAMLWLDFEVFPSHWQLPVGAAVGEHMRIPLLPFAQLHSW